MYHTKRYRSSSLSCHIQHFDRIRPPCPRPFCSLGLVSTRAKIDTVAFGDVRKADANPESMTNGRPCRAHLLHRASFSSLSYSILHVSTCQAALLVAVLSALVQEYPNSIADWKKNSFDVTDIMSQTSIRTVQNLQGRISVRISQAHVSCV